MDGEQTAPEIRALPACLVTRLLLLRQPTERDVPVIVRDIGNFKVSRWLGQVPYPYAPLHARQWLAVQRRRRADGRDLTFVIARRQKPHAVIGGIGSHGVGTLHPTVGYWPAPAGRAPARWARSWPCTKPPPGRRSPA